MAGPISQPGWPVLTPIPWPVAGVAGPAIPPIATLDTGSGPAMISLTSSRTPPALAAYEWNPSANGSRRSPRSGSAFTVFRADSSTTDRLLGEASPAWGGLFGLGGTSGSGSNPSLSSLAATSGESPYLMAPQLAVPGSPSLIASGPGSVKSISELAPGALPGPSSAPFHEAPMNAPMAVPEPSAVLSTLVGLGLAAIVASRRRIVSGRRTSPTPDRAPEA